MSGESRPKVKNKGTGLDWADLKIGRERAGAGRTLGAKGQWWWRVSLFKKKCIYLRGPGKSASGNTNGPLGRMNRPINAGRHSLSAGLIYEDAGQANEPLLNPKCTRTLPLLTHSVVCGACRS